MKKRIIILVILIGTLISYGDTYAQNGPQDPFKFNDWVVLTVAPAPVEAAIADLLSTNEFAIMRGFWFTGVVANMSSYGHQNAFAAMCIDSNGIVYAFIFSAAGKLIDYYAMGIFW